MLQKLLDKKNRKGFTMIEMLIVVAIIAILIAIAIPMYMGMLEKSRETADLANIRSAYAEVMVYALDSGTGSGWAPVMNIQQTQTGWNKVTDAVIHNFTTSKTKALDPVLNYHELEAPLKGSETDTYRYIVAVSDGRVFIGYANLQREGDTYYPIGIDYSKYPEVQRAGSLG